MLYPRRGLLGLAITGHLAEVMNIVTVVIEIAGTTGRLHDMSVYY